MFKIIVEVNKDNLDLEVAIDAKNSMQAAHQLYNGLKFVEEKRSTVLSKDFNRMSKVFIQGKGFSKDISEDIQSEMAKGRDSGSLLLEYFASNNELRRQRLEGLCQDVGNSMVMGMLPQNFSLDLQPYGDVEKPIKIESKSIQNLVRVNQDEYRWDHEELQYLFLSQSGKVFFRNPKGEIQECPLDALDPLKNSEVGENGLVVVKYSINGVEHEIQCLPLMKSNCTAHMKFDEVNEPEVTVRYAFESFDRRITFNGNPKAREVVSFEHKSNTSSAKILRQSEFEGVDTPEEKQCLELLYDLVVDFKLNEKGELHQRMVDFFNKENKLPMEQMALYSEFFQYLKATFDNYETYYLSRPFQYLRGVSTYKNHVYSEILGWESRITRAPSAERLHYIKDFSVFMKQTLNELHRLENRGYWQMATERLWGHASVPSTPTSAPSLLSKSNEVSTSLNFDVLKDEYPEVTGKEDWVLVEDYSKPVVEDREPKITKQAKVKIIEDYDPKQYSEYVAKSKAEESFGVAVNMLKEIQNVDTEVPQKKEKNKRHSKNKKEEKIPTLEGGDEAIVIHNNVNDNNVSAFKPNTTKKPN